MQERMSFQQKRTSSFQEQLNFKTLASILAEGQFDSPYFEVYYVPFAV